MTPKSKLPAHLSRKTKAWAQSVIREYDLTSSQVELLVLAGEARDAAEAARAQTAKHGPTEADRFGQKRESVHSKLHRDSSILYSRLVRELGLSFDDSDDARPPRIGG